MASIRPFPRKTNLGMFSPWGSTPRVGGIGRGSTKRSEESSNAAYQTMAVPESSRIQLSMISPEGVRLTKEQDPVAESKSRADEGAVDWLAGVWQPVSAAVKRMPVR